MIEKVRLGELCRIQGGYAFKSNQFQKNNIPIIRIGNIQENKVLIDNDICYTKEFLNSHPEFEIKNGDLLIAMSGATVGKVGIYSSKESALLNQRVGKFVITDKIESRYLYFLLLSPLFEKFILNNAFGCAQPNISNKQIEEFKFNKYSIETQIEIANKLDKVQEIIDLRKKQTEELDEFIKSQFVEMFGDIKSNDKSWKTKKGSELFIFSSGKGNITSNLSDNFEYKCYGGNGITGLSKDYLIDYDTIVIGRVGAYCGSVHKTEGKVWITDNAIYIKKFKEDNNIKFLEELFKVIDFHRFANFSGQPKITQQPLQNYNYILPPIELQNQFADIVKQIDKQKFILEKTLKETEELQESLMNKYFS